MPMLGQLPQTLEINGVAYKINTDYRNILRIFAAFDAEELSDNEKLYVCLRRLFVDFPRLPREDYKEAYEAAAKFIECDMQSDKPSPRVVNWEKDEQLIFAAINKTAGFEVRGVPYMHWWTLLGYFQSPDPESLWATILTIRQKRAQGKPLAKHEKEFYAANKRLCDVDRPKERIAPESQAKQIFEELLRGGGG